MRKGFSGLLAGGVALFGLAATALANVVIMESRDPNLRRGQEVSDETSVDVPFGQRLLVVASQNGELKTVEIKGPRKGKIKDLLNPEPISKRLIDMARNYATTGGKSLGSTAAARGARILVNHVPVIEQSTVCVEQGSLPIIALGSGLQTASLRLIDARNSAQARVLELSGQEPRASWPSALTLRNDGMYQILEEGQSRIDLTIKIVPNGVLANPNWVRSLEALERAGCEEQLKASLRSILEKV